MYEGGGGECMREEQKCRGRRGRVRYVCSAVSDRTLTNENAYIHVG